LLDFGARPKNLFGVDLLHDQIEEARTLGPHLHFDVADARSLPFEDGAFDLVLAFTLFSSIQTREIRQVAADEMRRVLRPGGEALVYDFRVAGWTNPDTRAIGLKELRELFRNSEVEARRLTLAPPIARMLAPRSWLACELLGQVPLLRTHWLAMVRPTD
jgi:ubiquinone/menaquinone biosynthesis C-methylase UbiE